MSTVGVSAMRDGKAEQGKVQIVPIGAKLKGGGDVALVLFGHSCHLGAVQQHVALEAGDLLVRPGLLAQCERQKVVESSQYGTPVGGVEGPQVHADMTAECVELHQSIEVSLAVTKGSRAS